MLVHADLHLHTALSSCAREDMTPHNIVNMALLAGLGAIAVTDHNSCANAAAVIKAAEGTGLLVIPGLEVQTREEVHVLTLFERPEQALRMQEAVYARLPERPAPPAMLGKQPLLREDDEVAGYCDRLLGFACDRTVEDVFALAGRYGGVMIPAHIDRKSCSILSNLGFIPEALELTALEISMYAPRERYEKRYPRYRILQDSDAHELGQIGIVSNALEVEAKTAAAVFHWLRTEPAR